MCLAPIECVKMSYVSEKSGELVNRILYNHNDIEQLKLKFPFADFELIKVKCNKCVECQQSYSREWAFRCMAEASLYNDNCFLTLTYKDNPVNLQKRDLILFLKRLRKYVAPCKIRYFACGEYGKKGKRPHYHLIIFGWKPNDLEYFFTSGKEKIYKSKSLEDIWKLGYVCVGEVTLCSAKYCAKYLQKSQQEDLKCKSVKPFITMSLKPGIGLDFFKKNLYSLECDKLYISGKYSILPRYFIEYARKNLNFNQDDLKRLRKLNGDLTHFDENKKLILESNLFD